MSFENKRTGTISGKDISEVNRNLVIRTAELYGNLNKSFLEMEKRCIRQNIKSLLSDFADEAREDKEKILELLNGKELDINTADFEYSMFDHLKVDNQAEEEEKLIRDAIKISEELRNIFSLLAIEYPYPSIRETFRTLVNHEILRKNQLEELYDEIITHGEW